NCWAIILPGFASPPWDWKSRSGARLPQCSQHLAKALNSAGGAAMTWIALKMLTGDRSKYLGLIFGVSFATLLMAQQISIFAGIMRRTASQILDVRDADIWVMDDKVRYIDEVPGLPDTDLQRVRGVPGVAWA